MHLNSGSKILSLLTKTLPWNVVSVIWICVPENLNWDHVLWNEEEGQVRSKNVTSSRRAGSELCTSSVFNRQGFGWSRIRPGAQFAPFRPGAVPMEVAQHHHFPHFCFLHESALNFSLTVPFPDLHGKRAEEVCCKNETSGVCRPGFRTHPNPAWHLRFTFLRLAFYGCDLF